MTWKLESERFCFWCDGTGEGRGPDSRCYKCHGTGIDQSYKESWEPDRVEED